jgi:hypothetical protein
MSGILCKAACQHSQCRSSWPVQSPCLLVSSPPLFVGFGARFVSCSGRHVYTLPVQAVLIISMAAANEIKLFGKWVYEGVTVGDLSVEDFIALKPKDHVSRRCGRSASFIHRTSSPPSLTWPGLCSSHGWPLPNQAVS